MITRASFHGERITDAPCSTLVLAWAKEDIYVAVLGLTGVGKSTFIKIVTGQDVKIGHCLTSSECALGNASDTACTTPFSNRGNQ